MGARLGPNSILGIATKILSNAQSSPQQIGYFAVSGKGVHRFDSDGKYAYQKYFSKAAALAASRRPAA